MGFSAAAYSMIFDSVNTYTEKKDIVRALEISTGEKRNYLEKLFDICSIRNEKPIWFLNDLERFFERDLNVLPFFRPEFFVSGYDVNTDKKGTYVTACGLKKIILILNLGKKIKD